MRLARAIIAFALFFLLGTASTTDTPISTDDAATVYAASAILFETYPDKSEIPICSAWTINTLEHAPGYYLATMSHCLGTAVDVDALTANPLSVRFSDLGPKFDAHIVSRGKASGGHDYAVLAVRTDLKIPILPIGRPELVEAGDWIMTVGCPLGLGKILLFGRVAKPAILIPRVNKIKQMVWTGNMVNDISSAGGLSGAPIWSVKQRAVVGLHVGSSSMYAIAVPISRMTPGRNR